MFCRSERLFLRPAWPEDWKQVCDGIRDAEIVRMLATAPWPYQDDDARNWVSIQRDPAEPVFVMTLPDAAGAPIIGSIGIHNRSGEPELGYWVAREYWGQGIATEAGKAILEVARGLGLPRVVAGHFVDNPASGRVLRKIGFVPTGEIRPEFSMARGQHVMSRRFTIELLGCDDGDCEADMEMPAAA